MLINQVAGYQTSKNYELLADLATKHSVICIVDYDKELQIRDCAATNYNLKENKEVWSISSRGYNYITAFNKKEFVLFCQNNHVEFIIPTIF